MNLIWPTNPRLDVGAVGRLGRVMHWLFAAMALAFVVGGASAIGTPPLGNALAAIGFGGGGCLLFGRALRYILAGE